VWPLGVLLPALPGLLTNAQLIETKMEMFKVCEKETKTKAYSKEGLARAAEMSPEEQAKADAQEVRRRTRWILQTFLKIIKIIKEGEKEGGAEAEARFRGSVDFGTRPNNQSRPMARAVALSCARTFSRRPFVRVHFLGCVMIHCAGVAGVH
jgi:hypothetical protein